MRKPKLTDEQIVALLREAERGENTITELCKKAGVSEVTFYRWRNKFSGNTVQDVRKLKQLEKDNARLLRLLGQRDVEIDAMKELLAKKW
ncbi:transposase [Geothrix sp. 21YS21S-2]|uniref:transposase n=1 Tax=Geothrix sp. 21YS21S-2 TaxID=3068893 RepID=UPI0027BA7759|nr:transposase [Geothrix sp. 21YS21S-2]